jgi:hypothetical protein
MLEAITRLLRRDKRGVSNVIVVMLSLILIVIIVANVVLLSYQMNQFDWERAQEKIEIVDVQTGNFTFSNEGPSTVHIVSLWIVNSTYHKHYDADLFVNSGENSMYVRTDVALPAQDFLLKVVTEKGNLAVYMKHWG